MNGKKIVFMNFIRTSSTTSVFLKIWHWEMKGIKYLRLYQQSHKYVIFAGDQNGGHLTSEVLLPSGVYNKLTRDQNGGVIL